MVPRVNRRDFLAASTVAGVGLATAGVLRAAPAEPRLHKAVIGSPKEPLLRAIKAVGFDGIESTDRQATVAEAEKTRRLAESIGLRIHSVMFGWADMNQGEAKIAEGVARMETALRAARGYGASTVLFVPCKIGGMLMPEPWEFDIRFDATTGHLRQVVSGDNEKHQKYIEAHNQAADAAREGVRRLIPTAEKVGVVIAVENVWNNLWVKPAFFANFVASFDSPWVRAYFDIGNHVKFAPPQEWIRTLGKLIAKCHVKDFKLNPNGRGGDWAALREGSVDWPAVRRALESVGYHGWISIEGNGIPLPPLAEQARRLDLIIAGK